MGLLDKLGLGKAAAPERTPDGIPVPPADLRKRVYGDESLEAFLAAGEAELAAVQATLATADLELRWFHFVLQIGSGAGRLIRTLHPWAVSMLIMGADDDAKAVQWCNQRIPFARFHEHHGSPPLVYPDKMFDLIIALGPEASDTAWQDEILRVAGPGAAIVLGGGAGGGLTLEQTPAPD